MLSVKNSARSLGIIVISIFGFLLILTFYTEGNQLKLTSREMHEKMRSQDYVIHSEDELQQAIWISLDDQETFFANEVEGAINIPLPDLLSDEYLGVFAKEQPKVLFAEETRNAFQAWSLLTQMGYQNIHVYNPSKNE